MDKHMDKTRRNLGELAAMAQQTDAMERHILSIASERLTGIEKEIEPARASALGGDDAAKDRYMQMVEERGRLQQVIARARAALDE